MVVAPTISSPSSTTISSLSLTRYLKFLLNKHISFNNKSSEVNIENGIFPQRSSSESQYSWLLCQCSLITKFIFRFTYLDLFKFPTDAKVKIQFETPKLNLVDGQRGKKLLLLDGYTLSQNNVKGSVTYWSCRHKINRNGECRARAHTVENPSGLFTVRITRNHIHPPKGVKWEGVP